MNTKQSQQLRDFFLGHKLLRYKKRETILFTKDVPTGVYYLAKGYVRSYLLSKEGKELTVTLLKPDDIFPLHWVINDMLTSHYFESLTEVELYRAPKENVLKLLKENPDIFFYTTSNILKRLIDASTRMETAILGNAGAKVAGILMFLAEHIGKKEGNEIYIEIPLTHKDIASLIGLTRETVSLEMEKLEKQQTILLKSHQLIIKNSKKLQEGASIE